MERKKRKQRRDLPLKDIDPTPQQQLILDCFEDYRYLTADLLQLLLGKGYSQYITILLNELQVAGFVHFYEHEPPLPMHWPDPVFLNYQSKRLKAKKKYLRALSHSFFVHDFHLNRYVASLQGEAMNSNIPFLTRRHITDKALVLPSSISHTFPNGKHKKSDKPTRPDDLFRIYGSNFAVELERGNPKEPSEDLDRSSPLRKILCYKNIIKTKAYEQLGLTNMRVIFVCQNKATVQHIKQLILDLIGPTNLFLLIEMDYLKGSPVPHLLHAEYERAGLEPTKLYKEKAPVSQSQVAGD
jgi:hypothetical protein